MPRKKLTGAVTSGSNIKFAAILAFFRTSPMEITKFAQELVNDAVKERENKGKAVLAGRAAASPATAAVDAATASASGSKVAGPQGVVAKKKPGPAKGSKRKVAGAATGASDAANQTSGQGQAAGDAGEVTGAALPPQDDGLPLDLDASTK